MEINEILGNHGGTILYIGCVIISGIILSQVGRMVISAYLKRSSDKLNSDPTNFRFLKNSVTLIVFLIAILLILYRLPGGETIAVSIFASAGIIAAIVGFASQAVLSNIVSGVFIVIFKPLRVGDLIQVGDKTGAVEDITLRHTVIRDFENKRIIIPNAVISEQTVVNLTIADTRICRHVAYRISYESDLELAKNILREEALAHPLCIDARTEEDIEAGKSPVEVRVTELSEVGVNIRANVWSESPATSWVAFTDINEKIKHRFDQEGIQIANPYRLLAARNQ